MFMVPCFSGTLFAFPCDQEQTAADEAQATRDAAVARFHQAQINFHVLEWKMRIDGSMTFHADAMALEAARREYAAAIAAARRARTALNNATAALEACQAAYRAANTVVAQTRHCDACGSTYDFSVRWNRLPPNLYLSYFTGSLQRVCRHLRALDTAIYCLRRNLKRHARLPCLDKI